MVFAIINFDNIKYFSWADGDCYSLNFPSKTHVEPKQQDHKFEASLDSIARPCFKQINEQTDEQIEKKRKSWRCSSVVKYLPGMCKALDSITVWRTKTKKQKFFMLKFMQD